MDVRPELRRLDTAREAGLLTFAEHGYRRFPAEPHALHMLGVIAKIRRELDPAEEWLARAAAAYAMRGDEVGVANTLRDRGDLLAEAGRLDEAEPLLVESVERLRATSAAHCEAASLSKLALLRLGQGRSADAVALSAHAASRFEGLAETRDVAAMRTTCAIDRARILRTTDARAAALTLLAILPWLVVHGYWHRAAKVLRRAFAR
jgi:tetratricopeptide (TPR) repeat protein